MAVGYEKAARPCTGLAVNPHTNPTASAPILTQKHLVWQQVLRAFWNYPGELWGNDGYCGYHGWMNAAMICKRSGLGKRKGKCIAFGETVGTPRTIIASDSVWGRVVVGPGDGCAGWYG